MRFRLLEWWRRWRATFRLRDESGTEEELQFHLEMAERDALGRGLDAREARLRAGGVRPPGTTPVHAAHPTRTGLSPLVRISTADFDSVYGPVTG